MRILVIDDEKIALEGMERILHKLIPDAELVLYQNVLKALDEITGSHYDVAFLDIEMRGMNGTELAALLKEKIPGINIIFATGYDDYVKKAMELHASGYIMKPVTEEKVAKELADLRYPVVRDENRKTLRIQAFGNFEVFLGDEPLHFQYTKTKELLAYLVDRQGALCSNGELMGILWEDDANPDRRISYLRNLRADLSGILQKAGYGDLLVRQRGSIGIVKEKVNCDYYEYLSGNPEARQKYRGEYMIQYSWSEFTQARLDDDEYNE